MDFTRSPTIESIITSREGCKLAIRSSKNSGQEEYFVEAVEIVSFGGTLFFRSSERPKPFLVPATDYEIVEVRETRMAIKNVAVDRAIKIGGGKSAKEPHFEKVEPPLISETPPMVDAPLLEEPIETPADTTPESRNDRRRDKRRYGKKRRGREEVTSEDTTVEQGHTKPHSKEPLTEKTGAGPITTSMISPVLPPPPTTLIADTIASYREDSRFSQAFYSKKEEALAEPLREEEKEAQSPIPLEEESFLESFEIKSFSFEPSEYGSFGEEEISRLEEESNVIIPEEEERE